MEKAIFVYMLFFSAIFLPACQPKKQIMEKATFEGEDLTSRVQIIRDKKSKKATIKIDLQGPWKLYSGYSIDDINFANPILIGSGTGTFDLNVADSIRSYFELVTDSGKAILSEKHLPMTGGFNFRDLGGVRTLDGRYVKWGKLFRTDDLYNLTPQDLSYLSYIPIQSVVDFRSKEEIMKTPDRLPQSVANVFELSLSPGNLFQNEMYSDEGKTMDFTRFMKDIYILLVSDSTCINRYREFFQVLQDEDNAPVLFHCTAGKDRTGMATVLVYYALGVDEDTIMSDYLTSNIYLKDKYTSIVERYPKLAPVVSVDADYLQAALSQIKSEFGTVENYLVKILGVDIDKMKSLYLY